MPRRGTLEIVSLILFQMCVIIVAFTSTKNSNSDGIGLLNKEVLSVHHSSIVETRDTRLFNLHEARERVQISTGVRWVYAATVC